jgi:hypothetical protein
MTVCKFDSLGLKLQKKIIPVNTCYLFLLLLLLFLQWLFGPFSGHGFPTYMSVSQYKLQCKRYSELFVLKTRHSYCSFSCHIQHNIPVLVPALLLITLVLSGNSKINLGCHMLETVLLSVLGSEL